MVLGGAENPEWTVRAFALAYTLAFKLDALGAVVGLVGAAAAISIRLHPNSRMDPPRGGSQPQSSASQHRAPVMADNPLTFLMVWEVMSLSAYFFVLTEPDQPEASARGH